ncbi:MAG: PilZ domain-containing protein, partial [Pseudomonadota bacterium]
DVLRTGEIHKNGTAITRNITLIGAKITTSQNLPSGAVLDITMSPFLGMDVIRVEGRVIWSTQFDEHSFDCGIGFIDLTENSKALLKEYMTDLEP